MKRAHRRHLRLAAPLSVLLAGLVLVAVLFWPDPAPDLAYPDSRLPVRTATMPVPGPDARKAPVALAPMPVPVLPDAPSRKPEPPGHAQDGGGDLPRVAILLDDMGLDRSAFRRASALPVEVSFAMLPYGAAVAELAGQVEADGRDVLLHMPMEPMGPADPGPAALRVEDDPATWQSYLSAALDRWPHFIGLNNHMGSRFTADRRAMDWLMPELRARGLFFLDSRTSAATQGADAAKAIGLPVLSRDVFLDADGTGAAAADALHQTVRIALKHGQAVAIGHPYPQTLAALESFTDAHDPARDGFRLVRLSELIARISAVR